MRPEIIAIMGAFMMFFGVALSVVGSKNDRITTLENEAIGRGHMMYCPKTGNLDWIENCEKVE